MKLKNINELSRLKIPLVHHLFEVLKPAFIFSSYSVFNAYVSDSALNPSLCYLTQSTHRWKKLGLKAVTSQVHTVKNWQNWGLTQKPYNLAQIWPQCYQSMICKIHLPFIESQNLSISYSFSKSSFFSPNLKDDQVILRAM